MLSQVSSSGAPRSPFPGSGLGAAHEPGAQAPALGHSIICSTEESGQRGPGAAGAGPGCSWNRRGISCSAGAAKLLPWAGGCWSSETPEELELHPRLAAQLGWGGAVHSRRGELGALNTRGTELGSAKAGGHLGWQLQPQTGVLETPRGAGALRALVRLSAPFDFGLPRDFPAGSDFPRPDALSSSL